MKIKILLLSLVALVVTSFAQARPPLFLMDEAKLAELKTRIAVPDTTHYEAYQVMKARVDANEILGISSYERGYMAREASLMYLLTDDASYLDIAFDRLEEVYTVSIPNGEDRAPDSGSGLGRAQTLASFAIAYNWGYDGFTQEQRDWIAGKANSGLDSYGSALGHPNIEYQAHNSNWNGVVAGAHVMSLIAMDQHEVERRRDYQRSREIIRRHISSYGDRGWTQEGNFYFGLSTEYTLPAMAAMRHIGDPYATSTFASRRIHHIIMYASAFNANQNSLTWGVGGDAIPNAGITSSLFALIPPGELPEYKWFFDRARGILNPAAPEDKYENHAAGTVYTLLFYPEAVTPISPEGGYPRVMDDNKGGYMMRSDWEDENATIVGLWADETNHGRSWSQADAGQISIMSAGSKWTAGPGPATSGLENAFSQIQVDGISRKSTGSGSSLGFSTSPTGGYARVDGGSKFSDLEVTQSIRHVLTDFSPADFDIISTLDEMRADQAVSYGWNAFVPDKTIATGTEAGVDYALITEGDAYLKIGFITAGGSFDNENGNVAYRYPDAADRDIWTVMTTGRGTPPAFSTSGVGNEATVTLGSSQLTLNDSTGRIESSTLTDLNSGTSPEISASPSSGLAPLQVQFSSSATVDPGETLSYFWDFGDGQTSTDSDPTHTYSEEGLYNVLLEVDDGNGGTDREMRAIFVGNGEPTADISLSESTVLPGASVTLDASGSSDPENDALTYEWDLGDGRTLTGVSHTVSWPVEDSYKIELRVTDTAGNVNVVRRSIQVLNENPRARFSFNSLGGYVPFTVEFDASESWDPEGGDLVYTWDFDDGSEIVTTTDPVVNHEFTTRGEFDVELTVEDPAGKTGDRSGEIQALGPEDEIASISDPGDIAQGLNYQVFLGDPSSKTGLPDINTLTPLKGGRVANPDFYVTERDSLFVIRYEGYLYVPETGAYAFRLSTENGSQIVISGIGTAVSSFPHSGVDTDLIALEAGYHPYRFETTYNPEDSYDRPNFNDLTWAPPGTDQFRPIPESLIFSNVNLLNPGFTATPGEVYDGGEVWFEATMNSPDGQPLEYLWDFDDGTTATSPRVSHTYDLPDGTAHKVYSVTLTVTDSTGASRTIGEQITVSRYATLVMKPRSGIGADQYDYDQRPVPRNMHEGINHALEPGTQLNFSSQLRADLGAAMVADGAYQTRWVSSNPTEYLWYHFQKDGVDKPYVISEYSLTAGGLPWTDDRDPKNWKIYGSNDPEPFDLDVGASNPSWTLIDSVSGQAGVARTTPTIYALPNTNAYAHYLFRLENQFDGIDGRVELTELQVFSYPDADSTVFGNQSPVADLDATPTVGEAPLQVGFDASGTVDPDNDWLYYQWDFGDGNVQHPRLGESIVSHTYYEPGSYTATLTVRDGNGATDTVTQTFTINEPTSNEPPLPVINVSSSIVPAGTELNFDASASSDPDGDAFSLRWEFGDGRKGEGESVTHTFDKPGSFDVVLIAEDARGRSSSIVQTIEVLPPNGDRGIISFNFAERVYHMSYTVGAGVMPVANWNNINYGAKPGYFDSHGEPVDVTVASDLRQTQERVIDELDNRMDGNERLAQIAQTHATFGSGSGFEWTVEGIPYDAYNVYVYYAGADSFNAKAVTVNGVDRYALKSGYDYPGPWTVSEAAAPEDAVNGANVLLWRNLSGSTMTLNISDVGSNPAILGFQVVDRTGAPDAPPVTEILSPVDGAVFASDDPVTLTGSSLQGEAPLSDPFIRWESDLEGDLGFGPELTLNDLRFGTHVITLTGTNESGLTNSDSITIEILPPPGPPILQSQTGSLNPFEGGVVELTADFVAVPEIDNYQWFKDGTAVSNSARISGAQSAVLTLQDSQVSDSGSYTLEATNSQGTTVSDPISLIVKEIPGLILQFDFGTEVDDPGGNWNTIDGFDTHTDFVHFISGEVTSDVILENINTGGDGLKISGASETWGSREIAPEWGVPLALSDRMWIDEGDSATLRFRNLQPGKTYDIEIASSFAASSTAGSRPGLFTMIGANGPVEGFNAHSGENLGEVVVWTSRGPDDGGDEDSAEGWLKWSAVEADAQGVIDIELAAPSENDSRVSINAIRIEALASDPPPPQQLVELLFDFGNSHEDVGGIWKKITDQATAADFIDASTEEVVPGITLENINTGGDGLKLSNATNTWGSRQVAPEWGEDLVLADRMWIAANDSATLRFSGLQAGEHYQLEIASSFDGGGSAGSRPGLATVLGANGAAMAVNAHSGEDLGTTVSWTTRGPNDGGDENAAEGWMKWPDVVADGQGVIEIQLSATSDSLSRVSVNAVRLLQLSGGGPPPANGLAAWRERYFGVTTNTGDAADLANPSGDGLVNLIKYALGMDPNVAAGPSERSPLRLLQDDPGAHLQLRLPADDQRDDIHYLIEYSADLSGWETVAEAQGRDPFASMPDSHTGVPEREGDHIVISLPAEALSAGFYRIALQMMP